MKHAGNVAAVVDVNLKEAALHYGQYELLAFHENLPFVRRHVHVHLRALHGYVERDEGILVPVVCVRV